MNFHYYIPTRILFGKGQLNRLHEQALPGKKALIVVSAGNSVKKYGTLDRVKKELELAGAGYVVYDKIQANPIKTHVMEGAATAKNQGCDFVIGLGGGSSIDAGKAIAVMAANPGDYWDYVVGGKEVMHKPLPVVAITTTAGTGTEADPWSVVTNEETTEKVGFGIDGTFPVLSIVDPELMASVPPQLTAFQGFDALFHSTEGYLASCATPISDLYAIKAISLVGESLVAAVSDGANEKARADIALANTLSGMVESTSSCTSEHSIEHAMSAYHPGLPHGAGLISISVAYYTLMAQKHAADGRMVEMAKALGKQDAKEPMDFVRALKELIKACHVDGLKLSDYGFDGEHPEKYAENARRTMGGLFGWDRVPVSDGDVVAILKDSYR